MRLFLSLLKFEFLQQIRNVYELFAISLFFIIGLFLYSLVSSYADLSIFSKFSFLWILMLFIMNGTLTNFFQENIKDYLDHLILAPLAIEWFLLVKIFVISLKLIVIFCVLLSLAFLFLEIPWNYLFPTAKNILLGIPLLVCSCSMAYSLCLNSSKKAIMMPFLVFPWQIPTFLLILSTYLPILTPTPSEQSFYFLLCLLLMTLPISCFISGQILKNNDF